MKMASNVELGTLGFGAAAELFQAELERVIVNILDPNTRADAQRSITLRVKIKPDKKSRAMCALAIECSSTLADAQPFESHLFVGVENGQAVSSEYNPQQTVLPGLETEPSRKETKVHSLGGK